MEGKKKQTNKGTRETIGQSFCWPIRALHSLPVRFTCAAVATLPVSLAVALPLPPLMDAD